MLLRRLVAALLGSAFLLSAQPVFAERDIHPPEDVMQRIKRTCKKFDSKDNIRCESREKQKWWASLRLTRTPKKAYDLYDQMDLGQGHLRARLQEERRQEQRRGVQDRTTYRQLKPVQNVNTERRPYLNDLQQARLECQLKPPGRQRSVCMDEVGNWARKLMQAEAPSQRYPAQ
ncbi:hypothetical protein A2881_01745 [Candidatus Peribacteria bacterium RIFCSPHIGHO2_01_FULL_55_13]|nr:MAG: hypothetical protein A2881_01745 [Candidatus Peribacteria bacterium RIFCSPHIGHO2_01_FULL_55_13]OGJ65720.1 MAG: hypothetical protein A3F36_03445 [Candidatus Peribacteria bacterium RIFCSPHIGHO2_12_FULL_55_11]